MKSQLLNILKVLFFLSIGALLIWLSFKDKSEEQINNIWSSVHRANYFWLSISVLVTTLSHFFRALRWKMLLKPLGYQPRTSATFFSVMVGYLANFAIHRAGEVARCGLLTKYEKVPFVESFATVIAERAFDVICVIILFFSILAFEFDRISGIANRLIFNVISEKLDLLMQKQALVAVLGVLILLVFLVLLYFRKKIQSTLSGKAQKFIKAIWDGLKSMKDVEKPSLFVAHTVLIWLMYILQAYVCFLAFEGTAQLSIVVAIVIVVFGSLAVVVVPGGTGAYQLIVTAILTGVYAVSDHDSEAFAWTVWGVQFLLIVALGLVSLLALTLLSKDMKDKS